jgi:type I restriction enzyme S subunit
MKRISTEIRASLFFEGECRLDATYYESVVRQAFSALEEAAANGVPLLTIGDVAPDIFNPPPIKRAFTDKEDLGTPYMLPQEMFDFYWEPRKMVLAEKMDGIADWFLKKGWVILTQSGSVGKPYFASDSDEGVILSQNAIRIPVDDEHTGGFLYAYLSSWIGQALLKKDKFGITVKHIRPHHVADIPLPEIDDSRKKEIGAKVKKAFKLRAQAIALLKEAKQQIYEELGCATAPIEDEEPDLSE